MTKSSGYTILGQQLPSIGGFATISEPDLENSLSYWLPNYKPLSLSREFYAVTPCFEPLGVSTNCSIQSK